MIDIKTLENECNKQIERILDLINVEYRCDNGWISIDCCFHKSNGGFNLKFKNGYWYCFSECRTHYSTISIVSRVTGLSIYETMCFLQEKLGIDCSVQQKEVDISYNENLSILKKYSAIKHKKVTEYKPVPKEILNDIYPYYGAELEKWGISKETAQEFKIGFAIFGEFADRICFPIDAPDGTIIGITGRLIDNDPSRPKYHLLKDMQVGNTLYNISRAIPYAKQAGYILVVEGMKSVLTLWEWGYKNAVAVFGASLQEQQARLLVKTGVKIVVVGDNDPAGRRMSQSCYNRCYKYADVIKLDIRSVTTKEKDSIHDLDIGQIEKLLEGVEKDKHKNI